MISTRALGEKPKHTDFFKFVLDDLEVDPNDVFGIQLLSTKDLGFIKFDPGSEAAYNATLLKLGGAGQLWARFNRYVVGWSCDISITDVKVMDVAMEDDENTVRSVFEEFGKVKDVKACRHENSHIVDGTFIVRIVLHEDKSVPCFIKKGQEMWHTYYQGQVQVCKRCDQPGHIGRFCRIDRPRQDGGTWAEMVGGHGAATRPGGHVGGPGGRNDSRTPLPQQTEEERKQELERRRIDREERHAQVEAREQKKQEEQTKINEKEKEKKQKEKQNLEEQQRKEHEEEQQRQNQIKAERLAALKPDASNIMDVDVNVNDYVVADQDSRSDGGESYGEFVGATEKLPPPVEKLVSIVKARRIAQAEVSNSETTETRKRSRSTSSVKPETDPQPTKHSRGKSSSRITANDNPVFLHDPDVRAKLPENEQGKVDKQDQGDI